jgi:hypothetical protein
VEVHWYNFLKSSVNYNTPKYIVKSSEK